MPHRKYMWIDDEQIEIPQKLKDLRIQKQTCFDSMMFEKVASLRDRELKLILEIEKCHRIYNV